MMWYDGHGGMGWGGWVVMGLTFVLFWGGIVIFAVWGIRNWRSDDGNPPAGTTPTSSHADDVLAERFARGEIDEDEFTHRRELLHLE
jgi:putative membrane protein